MRAMHKQFAFLLVWAGASAPAFGQGVAFFQDGVTMLPGGGLYDGTIDTEFRAANPTTPQDGNDGMSVDQFDGGFQTQGAIRFENLLISEGGLIPDGLDREDILFAELRFWKTSPSDSDANIDFSRVVGMDTTSGDFWQADDTWASLGGDLIPDEGGLLDGDPITRDNVEAASIPDFKDLDPARDSDDVLGDNLDAGLSLVDAIDQAFFRFDATDAVRDWLVDGTPNFGWAINNDTGNGWDVLTSEFLSEIDQEFLDAGFVPEDFRPALSIVFSAGPILDLDGDGDVDPLDFADFLDLLAIELDGPIPTGAPGDFNFDRVVDLDDFKFFKENYAEQNSMFPPGRGAAAAVPEPAAVVLAGLALLAVAGLRLQADA